jgi:hypothetical protein
MKVPPGKIPDVIVLIELLVIWLVGMLTVEYLHQYAQLNLADVYLIHDCLIDTGYWVLVLYGACVALYWSLSSFSVRRVFK